MSAEAWADAHLIVVHVGDSQSSEPPPVDFELEHHGSTVLMRPHTDRARDWIAEYIPEDAPRMGEAVAIEPRYVDAIARGAEGDGLCIRGGSL